MAAGGARPVLALEAAMALCMCISEDDAWPIRSSGAGAVALADALSAPARAGAVAAGLAAALRAERTRMDRIPYLVTAGEILKLHGGITREACHPELVHALLAFLGRLGRGVGSASAPGGQLVPCLSAAAFLERIALCDINSKDPDAGALIAATPGAAAALVSALRSALALVVAGDEDAMILLTTVCGTTGYAGIGCGCSGTASRGSLKCPHWCCDGGGAVVQSRARFVESLQRLGAAGLLEQALRLPPSALSYSLGVVLPMAVIAYRSSAATEGGQRLHQGQAPPPGTQALRQLVCQALAGQEWCEHTRDALVGHPLCC